MAETKVITIESVEDAAYDNKPYKKVMDTDGIPYNIKQGKEGTLKAKWGLLQPGATIKLTFDVVKGGEAKGKKYVADIEEATPKEVSATASYSSSSLSNASIEAQVAAKEIGMCWREGKLAENSTEVKTYRAWILASLIDSLAAKPDLEQTIEIGGRIENNGETATV